MIRYINVKSKHRTEFINITQQIEREVKESGVKDGVCFIMIPHTTAGVTINEGADPSVQRDIQMVFSRLIPHEAGYQHREGNSDAHIKSSIVGATTHIPIEEGKLLLGTWQSIYFCEFDGPRHRRVTLKFITSK